MNKKFINDEYISVVKKFKFRKWTIFAIIIEKNKEKIIQNLGLL